MVEAAGRAAGGGENDRKKERRARNAQARSHRPARAVPKRDARSRQDDFISGNCLRRPPRAASKGVLYYKPSSALNYGSLARFASFEMRDGRKNLVFNCFDESERNAELGLTALVLELLAKRVVYAATALGRVRGSKKIYI